MYLLRSARKNLLAYFDFTYLLKFGILMICMYSFNMLYIKLTTINSAIYSPVLANYLNYVSWIRSSIVYIANSIVHILGLSSYVINAKTLIISWGVSVTVDWPCVGLGVMSFWIAYIAAQEGNWKTKLYWSVFGVAAIWFMNCCRVALLLVALYNKENVAQIDHHRLFNICCYLLIIGMMYGHYKSQSKRI